MSSGGRRRRWRLWSGGRGSTVSIRPPNRTSVSRAAVRVRLWARHLVWLEGERVRLEARMRELLDDGEDVTEGCTDKR